MNLQKFNLLIISFLYLSTLCSQNASELIFLDQGKLSYIPFSMTGQSNVVNTIPDFSHAGYMGGGVSIPSDIPVKVTVIPEEGEDAKRIQEAINLVESLEPDQNGFRGVVLLKKGHYSLENILFIRKSGVVLRGEGQDLNGTVLHSNLRVNHSIISLFGSGNLIKDEDSRQLILDNYVPVGSHSLTIEDASLYSTGDKIVVTKTPNQLWVDTLGMDQETLCGNDSDCFGWSPSTYTVEHQRVITSITGNTITIDIPIVDVIETSFGGGTITKVEPFGTLTNCGIENIRIQSFYDLDTDESHAWTAVRLMGTKNCWVKQVTGQYLTYSTVNIESGNFNTIEDCAYIDPKSIITGGRRYSFAIQEGLGNLFQRCYAIDGRHDFVTGSRVTGPNVFLDGLAERPKSDIGPHHRWATGTLFDNLRGGSTRVWNRGSSGTGHGWSGAQTMFWNINSFLGEFRVDSPHGAINWGIGCIGTNQTGDGYWESWGGHVQPRSLYIQQLQDRLGVEALDNILIEQQKTGEIYDMLAAWAGQGDIADGGFKGAIPELNFASPSTTIDVSEWQGGDLLVQATDSDGTIESVKLLINGEPIGVDFEVPFLFTDAASKIQSLAENIHYLQAIATDNDGNTNITRLAILGGDPPPPPPEEEEESREEIVVFPNPVINGELTIAMKEEGNYTIRMYDTCGKLIQGFTFEDIEYSFFCNQLSSGVYIIEIQDEEEVLFKTKIVKMQ